MSRHADDPHDQRGGSVAKLLGGLLLGIPLTALLLLPANVDGQDDPTGIRYRRVFVRENQAAALVPSGYRPVTVELLERLLEERNQSQALALDEIPHLNRVDYRVSYDPQTQALRSRRSTLDLSYRGQQPAWLDLGRVNLAVAAPSVPAGSESAGPHWLTSESGRSFVAVTRSESLNIAWSLRGTELPNQSVRFLLQLPRCARSQMVLDLPADYRLDLEAGVVRELSSPPADADVPAGSEPRRWYRLELGGLEEVALQVTQQRSPQDLPPLVLRRQALVYEVSERSIRWTAQLTIDATAGSLLAPLRMTAGRIVNIQVKNQPARWEESEGADGKILQVLSPVPGAPSAIASAIDVTITGFMQPRSDLNELPWPQFQAERIVIMHPLAQAQLKIAAGMDVEQLELPAGWRLRPRIVSENGDSTLLCEGPMNAAFHPPQVSIAGRSANVSALAGLRLTIEDRALQGRWDAVAQVDDYAGPWRLVFESQWRVESLSILDSGRLIELPPNQRSVTIWPEANDVKDGRLRLRATGQRPIHSSEGDAQRMIDATWFTRLENCPTTAVAAVTPPQSFRWAARTVLRGPLVQSHDLPPELTALLGNFEDGTLLFRLDYDTTPRLELERPLPTIDARVHVALDADDDGLTENWTIQCVSPSAKATTLRLRCGAIAGRPPLTWAPDPAGIRGNPQLESDQETEEQDETWLLAIPAGQRGSLRWTARRSYPADPSQRVSLPRLEPHVINDAVATPAILQALTCDIGGRVQLLATEGEVQRVPVPPDAEVQRRLRYAADSGAAVRIGALPEEIHEHVLWEEQVDIAASARWGDTIIARYQTDGRHTLTLTLGADLWLTEATVNDSPLDPTAIRVNRDRLVIPSTGKPAQVMLRLERQHVGAGFWRFWEPPKLEVIGTVLQRQWRLWPAMDSFVATPKHPPPASAVRLPESMRGLTPASRWVSINQPQHRSLLVSSELAWAGGATTALLLFAVGWTMARSALLTVFWLASILATVAIAWPQWALVVVGFGVSPLISAALLARSLHRRGDLFSSTRKNSEALDLSVTQTGTLALLFMGAASIGHAPATAQQTSAEPDRLSDSAATADVEVFTIFVPIDEEGQFVGTRVYVPDRLYGMIFRPAAASQPEQPNFFRRADYRLRLAVGTRPQLARLEVRLDVETDQMDRRLQLPFPAAVVRDVETLTGGLVRSIRWLPSDNGIALQIPKTGMTTLRLSLEVPITTDEYGVENLQLPIPRIGASSLGFDLDASAETLAAPTALGRSVVDPMAGELTAELGPTDTLEVRWRVASGAASVQRQPLIRRYLVQANRERVVAECLIDASAFVSHRDDILELELSSDSQPAILSPAWIVVRGDGEPGTSSGRLRLRCTDRNFPPLRLAWETASKPLPASRDAADLRVYSLPTVNLVGKPVMGPTFIATNHLPDQVFQVEDARSVVPMPIDRFLAGWNSNVDVIGQAWVAEETLPRFLLSTDDSPVWQAEQSQQLLLHFDSPQQSPRLQLDYVATIFPGQGASPPLRILVPRKMRVHRVTMAGQAVDRSVRSMGSLRYLPLPEASGGEPIVVRLRGSLELPTNHRFAPPLVVLTGIENSGGTYSMVRSSELEVVQLQAPSLQPSTQTIATSERLARRIVPLWAWDMPPEVWETPRDHLQEGLFEVSVNPSQLDVKQVTRLTFESGRWFQETIIHAPPIRGRLDFLTLEMPSRWNDDLMVDNAEIWSSQPAVDPAKRLLRILPADSSLGRQEIRIRSRLAGGDLNQISAPQLRVLGAGPRRTFVTVPSVVGDGHVAWETVGTRQAPLPDELAKFTGQMQDESLFECLGTWAVTMAASAESPRQPLAAAMDVQYFAYPNDDGLLICRWDLYPASESEVTIALPDDFAVVHVWSAGQRVVNGPGIEAQPSRNSGDSRRRALTIPLNIDRLAQPLVLLGRYHPGSGNPQVRQPTGRTLPSLTNIPVKKTWLTWYDVAEHKQPLISPSNWQAANQTQRGKSLANSVLQVMETSRESLANRPRDEVSAWVVPWTQRFNKLVGGSQGTDQTDLDTENALVERMSEYLESVVGSAEAAKLDLEAAVPPVPGWNLVSTAWQADAAATLPAVVTFRETKLKELGSYAIAITTLWGLITLAVWQFRVRLRRHLESPAVWLFMLGLVGFILAPVPVAVALCFIAVSAPMLRRQTPRNPSTAASGR